MNIINARIMLIENCLSILVFLFALPSSIFISYIKTVIVLFKVVSPIFMSTNTDSEWSVTNSSNIDTNFISFCYFVGKLISVVFTILHMQVSTERGCVLRPIY